MNEFIHELDAHSVSYKEETEVHITMTFGIVEAGEQFANIDSMVSGADQAALYRKAERAKPDCGRRTIRTRFVMLL